jgi:(p)ppGpp synthase/HD superfamily hydrolase
MYIYKTDFVPVDPETDVFNIAYNLAYERHIGQMYGDKPYMYHIDSVIASVIRKWGSGNRAILAIAALHDVLEDTDLTEAQLVKRLGKDITKCVVALSKIVPDETYEQYIYRVREFHYSKEVKIHDTLCNLIESIMADSAYRVKKYTKQLQLLVQSSDPIQTETKGK